jgi:hypothetical protein
MISDTANNLPKREKTWRDMMIIVLVFILLAILVWRWFDFRIASLSHELSKPSSMKVVMDDHSIQSKQ